ncbi:MAG: hypothetical protein JST26_07770 [Bacteroidetes bacterium]|nr:hypothetical protein [Bacteroidota bacterium]
MIAGTTSSIFGRMNSLDFKPIKLYKMKHSTNNHLPAFHSFRLIALILTMILTSQSYAQIFGKKDKKEKNTELIFEIPGRVPSDPSKLPIHDKYVGKIVFSDQQLKLSNCNESMFKSSFKLGDPIYARVFTSNSVENYMLYHMDRQPPEPISNMRYSYTIYYFVDSVKIMEWVQYNKEDIVGVNTWQRFIMVDPKLGMPYDWKSDEQRKAINNLKPGVHKVKVEIWAGEGRELSSIKPIAVGEFDLTIEEGVKAMIGKKWSGLKTGDMASDMKVKTKLTELYTEYFKTNMTEFNIKDFKITSDGYSIKKNQSGLPQYRYLEIVAYGIDKKTGKCYALSSLYAQDYAGGGTYSTNFYKWGNTSITEYDCE